MDGDLDGDGVISTGEYLAARCSGVGVGVGVGVGRGYGYSCD